VNSSLDTWDQSAGATLIERRLVSWTAARAGLPEVADGVFTSGGTQSNLQALFVAKQEALRRTGTRETDRLRIFASEVSHFSVTRAAQLVGLPPDAVVTVPCDERRRMRTDALVAALSGCRERGLVPAAVVATAGTTDFGSIDPLPDTARACRTHGVWLHVDAAYGCGLLVSPTRRHLLAGLERADSVTVDYHKSFFQPVSASAVLVRDPAALRHVRHHADYLNPRHQYEAGIPNQVDKSLQTTRRFDALKLWLTLRVLGAESLGELFDEVVDRAAQAWELLAADGRFEVLLRPTLSTLVFRYRPPHADGPECDRVNLHARQALHGSGEGVVAGTVADGRHFLKFTLLNPHTSLGDIEAVLELIAHHAEHAGKDRT
jgi:L-2,4-diaminobutyrate decarboxylase